LLWFDSSVPDKEHVSKAWYWLAKETETGIPIADSMSSTMMGYARVRHCSARGLWKYAVGLEFGGPLMPEHVGCQIQHVDVNTGEWADGQSDSYGWPK
jgi:hypothetical protein